MDGKRQQLETFRNKFVDARKRGFHFEQVWSPYVVRLLSYERGEDGLTDRRFFLLYLVDMYIFNITAAINIGGI